MIEPVVAFVAILILYAILIGISWVAEDLVILAAPPLGIVAIYFLVRIIHWAWETPIPFLS